MRYNPPMFPRQQTIHRAATVRGIGLHTGRRVTAKLIPSPINGGIIFRRTDLSPPAEVRAAAANVGDTRLATCLRHGRAEVSTVEHFLSALSALGIDNLTIEVDAPELPIMDGSAAPWALLLQSHRIVAQDAAKRYIRVKKPVEVQLDGGGNSPRRARFEPFDGFRFEVSIDFPHSVIRRSESQFTLDLDAPTYLREIARARTFGYVRDVENMRRMGRILGASFDNAVVFDDFRVLNEEGLRYADEFVRHKMLDAIGDCYVNGAQILGRFIAHKPGHELNNALLRRLLNSADAWEWMESASPRESHLTSPADFSAASPERT